MGRSQSKISGVAAADRSIFVVSWGRNGHSSWSFHKCILITDVVTNQVTRETTGTHYDWGSIVENVTITEKPPVQIRRFNTTMFDKGVQFRNSYTFKGTTNWSDEKIKKLFDRIGNSYSVITNNCRDVAEGVARALKERAETASISRIMEVEFDIRQQRARYMSPMIIGVPAYPMGAYLRGRQEEQLRAMRQSTASSQGS
ncbi:hypothetical protein F4806DRAFT_479832 [Annulohypoxylon nitens]|nr:hypothetical protein F4806DRAFT_479832 [Annulohypoxylon nitens]